MLATFSFRRFFATAIVLVAALCTAFGVAIMIFSASSTPRLESHTPVSAPNGRYSGVVAEPPMRFVDRNFRLLLVDNNSGNSVEIFRSKDQSPSIRLERVVWSPDSRYLALVGDRYYVVEGCDFDNGEFLFLVYDTVTKVVYCNADDDFRFSRLLASQAKTLFDDRLPKESVHNDGG